MKRRSETDFPLIKLCRKATETLARQLYAELRRLIITGTLPLATTLPSSRVLAQRLHVSRNTVLDAYQLLTADGLIGGRTGSGTRVLGASVTARKPRDLRWILREAHYPSSAVALQDPDGNSLYLHK